MGAALPLILNLTIALAAAFAAGLDASRPGLMAFFERIHARPVYRRVLERGGEDAYSS